MRSAAQHCSVHTIPSQPSPPSPAAASRPSEGDRDVSGAGRRRPVDGSRGGCVVVVVTVCLRVLVAKCCAGGHHERLARRPRPLAPAILVACGLRSSVVDQPGWLYTSVARFCTRLLLLSSMASVPPCLPACLPACLRQAVVSSQLSSIDQQHATHTPQPRYFKGWLPMAWRRGVLWREERENRGYLTIQKHGQGASACSARTCFRFRSMHPSHCDVFVVDKPTGHWPRGS
jgi:hypothetical protein